MLKFSIEILAKQPGFNLNKRMIKKPVTQPKPVFKPVTQPVIDFSIKKIYFIRKKIPQ